MRAAAKAIGEDKLGFKVSEIGTHSLRSGAAMARKQVEQFSHNAAQRMIKNLMFRYIPEIHRTKSLPPRPPPEKPS